jgi:DNA-binding CsgD family transcriptional regulator
LEAVFRLVAGNSKPAIRAQLAAAGPRNAAGHLALEGVLALYDGDVRRAVALLRRAYAAAPPEERVYIVDILAPIYVMRSQYDDVDDLLSQPDEWERIPGVRPAFGAIVAAGHHDRRGSLRQRAAAKEQLESVSDALVRCRILQRLALAAYMTSDAAEATDLALAAAMAAESVGAYNIVCGAYSVAYSIQHSFVGDIERAYELSLRVSEAARRSGNDSFEIGALIAQYEMAVELADEELLEERKREIALRALPEQYHDRFNGGLAELVPRGWKGDFTSLRAGLIVLNDIAGRERGERALTAAIRSLAEVALGETAVARKYARKALALASSTGSEVVVPGEQEYLRLAQIMAASACVLLGDSVRGRRVLSSRKIQPYAQGDGFLGVLDGGRWEEAARRYRGYTRLVASVRAAALTRRTAPLTPSELEVLKLLADGRTAAEIARETARSVFTVRAHTRSIIAKLDVHGRVAAISAARSAGLLP